MIRIVSLFVSIFFTAILCEAQTPKPVVKKTTKKTIEKKEETTPKVEGAGISFEKETLDYGTIPHNSNGVREFKFTNNGNKALLIKSANSSCGCTVPSFPKDSIQPGEKGVISVKYDTKRAGPFNKMITVTSNAKQGTKKLIIKGNISPAIPKKKNTSAKR